MKKFKTPILMMVISAILYFLPLKEYFCDPSPFNYECGTSGNYMLVEMIIFFTFVIGLVSLIVMLFQQYQHKPISAGKKPKAK